MFLSDTTPEAASVQIEAYRRMTGEERVRVAFSMCDDMRELLAAGVRARNPELDEAAVSRAVARILLGDELYERASAFGIRR